MRRRTFLQWLGLSPILATQDSKVWDEDPVRDVKQYITNVLETPPQKVRELEYLSGAESLSNLPEKFNQLVDAVRKLQHPR